MTITQFNASKSPLSIGVELELQLINPNSYDLAAGAKEVLRDFKRSSFADNITPEITQSIIEINSSVHQSVASLYKELLQIKEYLAAEVEFLNLRIAGGGTHPFQRWSARRIFPTTRYKSLAKLYGYLAKRSTIFALHVHLGCSNGDDAIYLTHMLSRYVAQFIALSASSPFYQGVNTNFNSARINNINNLPFSGIMPYFSNWQEFSDYFASMCELEIIESMKDFHWDIRPKPDIGTVEIRVCDMPLTLEKVVSIVAYMQAIAHYLLTERPNVQSKESYYVYSYNRFQAGRFGLEGKFIDYEFKNKLSIKDDILNTMLKIREHTKVLDNLEFVDLLRDQTHEGKNDSCWLKEMHSKVNGLAELVKMQCNLWEGKF